MYVIMYQQCGPRHEQRKIKSNDTRFGCVWQQRLSHDLSIFQFSMIDCPLDPVHAFNVGALKNRQPHLSICQDHQLY